MYRTLRIQPMRELFTMQDSMDRLVNAFFDSDEKSLSDTVAPRVDLKQDEDKISIKMTIRVSIRKTSRFLLPIRFDRES